ncbi:hypothetical protein FLP15_08375 [Lactococcus protaetiae]|uniref:SpaA-like prealbumin fold domain-containing protein n=2 Tax=Lactococcus protaetiae TaxID=2592653 RepID=A0A514Z9A8_9LACT|nr:hypothetical protein FLP15_08375 [Lactococcus protaetiae]
MIATSEDNANAGKYLASDGNSYTTADTLPSGVSFLTSTSDGNGHATFDGLPLAFNDGNGNGILDWTDSNSNGIIDPGELSDGDTVQSDYWVVETKAPAGYELLKTPQKVTVNDTTSNDSTIELTVADQKSTDLPFTGGAGQVLLVTLALGSIGIGTAIIVARKKRQSKEV